MASFHNRTFGQASQDTIFIRGFSIRQDVDDIRDYFYDEGRCSVVFFKENQHFQKLFIALKFESVSIAKKVMKKYNDAEVMGDWLQLSWFKKAIYVKDDEHRYDDYRNDDRRQARKRYESRSRSRSRGRSETPPRRRRQRSANSASDDERKKSVNKDHSKRNSRRRSSSSESDDGSNNNSKNSVYKEPPTIWNKPEKIDISVPTLKAEIKREPPAPVPAPVISDSRSSFANQNTSNNVNGETTRTVKATVPRSPSSAEYSSQESESSPPPPVKPKKKKCEKVPTMANAMKPMKSDSPPPASNAAANHTANPATNAATFAANSSFQSSSFGATRVHSSFMQNSNHTLSADLRQKVSHLSPENVNLVKIKKEDIEMCYRQDCDTFSMVVRMLINKDPSLEPALQPSLKENLKCIGTKCIFELRDYIEQLRNDSINDIF